MVHLEAVNEANWRLGLQVAESQKRFVADSNTILARAFAYRDHRSNAYVIYDGETPVGMVMYYDCEALNAYDFSQLFIDARYQGKGHGKAALALIFDRMRADGKYKKVCLCYIEGNTAAKTLYEQFGFQQTDRDGNEIIMEMDL